MFQCSVMDDWAHEVGMSRKRNTPPSLSPSELWSLFAFSSALETLTCRPTYNPSVSRGRGRGRGRRGGRRYIGDRERDRDRQRQKDREGEGERKLRGRSNRCSCITMSTMAVPLSLILGPPCAPSCMLRNCNSCWRCWFSSFYARALALSPSLVTRGHR